MNRNNATKKTLDKKTDRWSTARRVEKTNPVASQELSTLHDRKSDMATIGSMIARIRAERR